jgi:predicted kinase
MRTMANQEHPTGEESNQKVIRLVRPSVVALCGPAACGKTTFAARHFRPTQIISSDHARALVCDDERDQRFQTQAFALVHFLIEQRLSINRLCVVDSTALTAAARRGLLELARRYNVPAVLFLFDVPLETCIGYDQKRERVVGRQVIERQYQLFEQAKSTVRDEGFDQIVVLGDEDMEKAQVEIVFRPVARPAAERPDSSAVHSARRPPAEARGRPPYRRPSLPERAPASPDANPPRASRPQPAPSPQSPPVHSSPPPEPRPETARPAQPSTPPPSSPPDQDKGPGQS